MKSIEWINNETKLNKTTMDNFQNNINDEFTIVNNGIKDVKEEQEVFSNSTIYSFSEKKIGTWVNDKAIYRVVIPITNQSLPSNKWLRFNISDYVIDEIINVRGMVLATSSAGTNYQIIPRIVPDNIAPYSIGFGDMLKTEIGLQFGSSYTSVTSGYIILEYTKTET